MNHIAPPPEPLIREVPLSCLALAPENVRKTPANQFAEAELVASIKAHGLLENLVARADDPDSDGTERFAVVAGGRRLAALKALAEDGTLDANHPVPCKIAANGNAGELSLAENVIRIAMHPADQVVAFSQLARSGITAAAIAARFGPIHPEPAEPTDAEKAEIDKLRTRHDELANMDDDAWTEALVEEAEGIEPRLDEIEAEIEARARFKPEDFAMAGCIATIGRDGTLQVIQGLVKPEDMPKPAEAADAGTNTRSAYGGDTDTGADAGRIAGPAMSTPMQLPKDREAEARKEAGVGIGLGDDLRSIRTALVKAHLAGDFEAAFDLMVFQLVRAVFAQGCTGSWHALDIAFNETADRPTTRTNDDDFAGWSPGEAMLADWSHLPFEWMEGDDDAACFAALRALPRADKEKLFAAAVARTVKGQLAFEHGARPELEATVARLDIDFAKHVRPTADMLWSRIRKDRILDVACLTLGTAWASARSKYKKADLATAMEEAFAAGAPPIGIGATAHAAAGGSGNASSPFFSRSMTSAAIRRASSTVISAWRPIKARFSAPPGARA